MTPDSEIGRMLAGHAGEDPARPAVISATGIVTYRDLVTRADHYRAAMAEAGLRPGDVVAMTLPDGADAIAALVAAFTAGTAFVWLDEDQPVARHQAILGDCAPVGVVATRAGVRQAMDLADCPIAVAVDGDTAEVAAGLPGTAPGRVPTVPLDASCLVYTSGSTGRPKGIVQRSGNLMHFSHWLARDTGIGPGARLLQWARLSYDASYLEILGTLLAGAALVLPPPRDKPDGTRVREWVAAHEVTHVFTVPTLIRRLLLAREEAADKPAEHLRAVSLYGEPLHSSLVSRVRAHFPAARVYNLYGPAESAVATFYSVPEDCQGDVPIGTDIDGIETMLRDGDGNPVPDGATGEVWLQSRYLAHGYLGRPEETRAVFLPGEAPGTGIYRTGDLARRLPGGALLFLGRRDNQVKIRGARVELAEIEAALFTDPNVAQAAVGVFTDESGTTHPAAYLEPRPGGEVDVRALHRGLASTLPAYMVPAAYLLLDRLPTTSTGKIDRQRLPDPRPLMATSQAEPAAKPGTAGAGAFTTETELGLAAIWCRVLRIDTVSPDDDFFALKGHSLLAVRITAAVIEEFGVDIPVRAVFEHPTVPELAAYIDEAASADAPS